eukprot:3203982-Lingulodinium_polyedra.AAC.1
MSLHVRSLLGASCRACHPAACACSVPASVPSPATQHAALDRVHGRSSAPTGGLMRGLGPTLATGERPAPPPRIRRGACVHGTASRSPPLHPPHHAARGIGRVPG